MSGKMNKSFKQLFSEQIEFQNAVLNKCDSQNEDLVLPVDSVYWFKYHCLAMLEEMGEVLKADKRWKSHRNSRFEPEEKLDELADVFITTMNLCIFSGFTPEQVEQAVKNKIDENFERLENENHNI